MNIKNMLTIILSVLVSLVLALTGVKLLAPSLLGGPVDLQLVKSSKEVPPFFDNIFREEDRGKNAYILNDPNTVTRSKPMFPDIGWRGPNDILGFRNTSVPIRADVVITGDSQTYSENVAIEYSWPKVVERNLAHKHQTVYSMATGGWDAVRYLEIYPKMLFFKPQVTIVAFYTGNDPLESFVTVYGSEKFKDLRLNDTLKSSDVPKSIHGWPVPRKHIWALQFSEGVTAFTPYHRYRANMDHLAVDTGYDILLEVAKRITGIALANDVLPVFTIIPTKELVYEKRVAMQQYSLVPGYDNHLTDYLKLVEAEKKRIEWLAGALNQIQDAVYVDLLTPLQEAALNNLDIYPRNSDNGHPDIAGYRIIGKTIANVIDKYTNPPLNEGPVIRFVKNGIYVPYFFKNNLLWSFSNPALFQQTGYTVDERTQQISLNLLKKIPKGGVITSDNIDKIVLE